MRRYARAFLIGSADSSEAPTMRTFHCTTCPYETDDEHAALAHISRKGWLGRGETHSISLVGGAGDLPTPDAETLAYEADNGPWEPSANLLSAYDVPTVTAAPRCLDCGTPQGANLGVCSFGGRCQYGTPDAADRDMGTVR